MKLVYLLVAVAAFVSQSAQGQDITFGTVEQKKPSSSTNTKKDGITNTRAASTYQNCNCQCDSVTWSDGNYIRGNCRSQDKNGALFCYVSGSALCACRDVQVSSFLKGNDGRFKYYSYEACTTPPRNQCSNYGIGNYGDGDFKYCNNGGFGGGNYGSGSFGGSGNYGNGGSFGGSNFGHNSGRPNYGSNYGSNRPSYGNNRPNYGGNRPFRGGSGSNNNSPSLDDILSGVRKGSSSSSSSSDSSRPSSGAIKFDA